MRIADRLYLIFILLFSGALMSYFVASRSLDIGADSYSYALAFDLVQSGVYEGRFEPGFVFLMSLVGLAGGDYRVFLFSVSFLMVLSSFLSLLYVGNKEGWSYGKEQEFFVFLLAVMLVSPFFFSAQVNVIRHGLAAPFLLMAFCFFDQRKYFYFLLFSVFSMSFHWSAAYFLALAPLLRLKLKYLLMAVAVLSFLYLSNFSGFVVGAVSSKFGFGDWYRVSSGFGEGQVYRSGVRYDFWAFSFTLILVSLWLGGRISSEGRIVKYLLLFFTPFLLMGFVSFSDRLLVYLWFMFPLVVCGVLSFFVFNFNRSVIFVVANVFMSCCLGVIVFRLV